VNAPKDRTTFDPPLQATIPQITFIEGGFGDFAELKVPEHTEVSYFGASFSVYSDVPEPSMGGIVGVGIAGLLVRQRLRAARRGLRT
jgi:hypothetical protein